MNLRCVSHFNLSSFFGRSMWNWVSKGPNLMCSGGQKAVMILSISGTRLGVMQAKELLTELLHTMAAPPHLDKPTLQSSGASGSGARLKRSMWARLWLWMRVNVFCADAGEDNDVERRGRVE